MGEQTQHKQQAQQATRGQLRPITRSFMVMIIIMSLNIMSLNVDSPISQAQARGRQPSEGRERAYQLIERAERAVSEGALTEAITLYERAYRALPEHKLLWRVALLSDDARVGCAARLRAWERLSMTCARAECSPSWATRESYERAQRQCEVRLKVGLLQATQVSHREPLKVILDDELRGEAPLSLLTSVGEHRLTIYQGEERLYDEPLTLREGQPHSLTLSLTPQGELSLHSPPSQRSHERTEKHTERSKKKHTERSKKKHTERSKKKHIKKKRTPRSNPPLSVTPPPSPPHAKLIKGGEPQTSPSTPLSSLNLEATLVCQYQEGGQYHDYPDCDGATLTEGDRFKLILKSSAEAHLYLMMHNAHGERAVLFPERGVPNQVRGGVSYLLPSEGWYELDEKGGVTERLQLIASREPLESFERARGLRVSDELMERLRRTAARGVVRRGAPATLSERLGALDRVLITEGSPELAAVRFTLEHR